MSEAGSYGYEKQRITSELTEHVCVALTLILRSRHVAQILAWYLKLSGCVHTCSRGVPFKGTNCERCLIRRKHNLKRPKQPQ